MAAPRSKRPASAKPAARTGRPAASPQPKFFATPAAWRAWLEKNHEKHSELWVGYWKVTSGKPSITWPQSVDEALCFGWIDGLRRSLDETSYMIRFTPRKPTSIWSRVNVNRYGELDRQGLVRTAGRAAFERKKAARTGVYGYELANLTMDAGVEKALKADAKAWKWFCEQTPGYRKLAGLWPSRAKRAETRERRLATLLDCCRRGVSIPPLIWGKQSRAKPAGAPAAKRKGARPAR